MSWRAQQITKAVRRYDRELYAQEYNGRIDIFRRTYSYVPYNIDGVVIKFLREEPYRVFCLTDNWKAFGRPVSWGIEPILAKLKASDLWQRNIGKEANSRNEKIDASHARSRKSEAEAFLKDYRREFARTFDDVNTANMSKRTDRRFKDDKKLKGI